METKEIQVFSDSHYPIDMSNEKITHKILKERDEKKDKYLFLLGDVLDVESPNVKGVGIKSQEIVNILSKEYDNIVTVLGNHEFREPELQTKKGYNNYKNGLNKNVIFPEGLTKPIIIEIDGTKLLVGNLFYDMNLLDPSLFGFTKEQILKIYNGGNFPDGKHLFNGNIDLFSKMQQGIENNLSTDIDMLVTHSLAHASLVQFLALGDISELQKKVGGYIKMKNPGERHYKDAEKLGISIEDYILGYNAKSYFMGSNVLGDNNKIKDGLIAYNGHSHRDLDYEKRNFEGKEIIFKSKQYYKK